MYAQKRVKAIQAAEPTMQSLHRHPYKGCSHVRFHVLFHWILPKSLYNPVIKSLCVLPLILFKGPNLRRSTHLPLTQRRSPRRLQAKPNLTPQTPNANTQQYLEVQGDLVSGLIMGIIRVTIWVSGVINLLILSPSDPPSRTKG